MVALGAMGEGTLLACSHQESKNLGELGILILKKRAVEAWLGPPEVQEHLISSQPHHPVLFSPAMSLVSPLYFSNHAGGNMSEFMENTKTGSPSGD